MIYDFDNVIDRRGSGAIMTDTLMEHFGRTDVLPMWIADMDFATPDPIRRAIEKRLDHQVYGYSIACQGYWQSIIDWEMRMHGWSISREELTFIPGIVRGISFVLQHFTKPGDNVLVQPPVYMPFLNVPRNNGRNLVYNPLVFNPERGTYEMDLCNLEEVCRESRPKVMIISNPHNPAGIVWPKEVLAAVAEICAKYGVLVISDEIHSDMALYGFEHTPFPLASKTARDISITFAAPSKTFNMAGIVSSFCVVSNPEIRNDFYGYLTANELNSPMFISCVATKAAYTECDQWRLQMLSYVQDNIDFVCDFVSKNIPGVKIVKPEASFLIWLDCSGLGLDHDRLLDLFINKAKLGLNDGEAFGPGGEAHMRFNVGCPRSMVRQALEQLRDAVASLNKQ